MIAPEWRLCHFCGNAGGHGSDRVKDGCRYHGRTTGHHEDDHGLTNGPGHAEDDGRGYTGN